MPYNGVKLAGYVRRVLSGHEDVDLNRLLETHRSIQDFENSLISYAPYLGISLKSFSYIKKDRFHQIFSTEQFFKRGDCIVPANFQWNNFQKKDLRTLLERFIKVFVEITKKARYLQLGARKEAAEFLRKTCGILYNPLQPDLLEKTIAGYERSPYLVLSQTLSKTATVVRDSLLNSQALAQTQIQRTLVVDQSLSNLASRDVQSGASAVVQGQSLHSQALEPTRKIRKKYLNRIVELERQIEQARYALNYAEQQQSREVSVLQERLIQVQVELQLKLKALETLTLEKTSNERAIRQFEYEIAQYKIHLFRVYEAYTKKVDETQRLEREYDSLRLEGQKNSQRIQQLEAQLDNNRQTVNQIQVNIGIIAPAYFQVKAEKSSIEDALSRAVSDIEVLKREYKEKFVSFEAQLKELQGKEVGMATTRGSISELQKIILEKEKQLKAVEEKLSQIESSYRSQIEELQEKLCTAEEAHQLNLLRAKQEHQKILIQREEEQARLKDAHSLSVKTALQELEESYRIQIAALQEQGREKDKALSSATDNQVSFQLKVRQLEVQFEYEKIQLRETLEEQFQEKFSAFMESSQEQIEKHKLLYEGQHQILLRTQQEKDDLQRSFAELQGQLQMEREKFRQKEETLQLVQNQKSSLEVERQVHVADYKKRLEELREISEQQSATLRQDLDLERTKHLEKLRIKEEELMVVKVALQQVKTSKESLEVQLEKIRLEKTAKEKTETAVCSDGLASVSADVQSKTEREVVEEPGVDQVQSLERENQMLRLKIKELEEQNKESLRKAKAEAEERVERYKGQFEEMTNLKEKFRTAHQELEEDYERLEQDYAALEVRHEQLSGEIKRYKSFILEGDKENRSQGQLVQYANHRGQNHQTQSDVTSVVRSPLRVIKVGDR